MDEQSSAIFQLRYSYYLETMTAVFHNRADKLMTAIQLISGTAVFASTGIEWLFALPVVVIATVQLVWQPSIIAERASVQRRQYADLLFSSDEMTDDVIRTHLKTLHHSDSTPFGALLNPAYKRAAIASGLPDDHKLTFFEKVMAWFAGDLPR
ncbi:hypothetical protein CV016_10840 [Yersinia kristensenii]|uniref:Uncharacterized protein n=1 Tax=Yersinia kristensenii TaxID=28152 RepID=A0A0T9KL36_YERKR|nr:hypothetical protein [Yersinia kristensenii]ELY5219595.1 hypothetical protein [Yersinia enterocolitica]PJG62642.1 hypothetical protein CV016_10840 [Yersinia kristensenii]CNE09481.1 Uncharacterised protein [Yersinia kristensenii]HEM6615382.1 hypothetical protein [Yersinia enterocolitica]HEN3490998.1 hypothetical protein [Yersinia enterocolitica]